MQSLHGELVRPNILLNDNGVYIESQFYSFISESSLNPRASQIFENYRDKKIS